MAAKKPAGGSSESSGDLGLYIIAGFVVIGFVVFGIGSLFEVKF